MEHLKWNFFYLKDVYDPRIDGVLKGFSAKQYKVRSDQSTPAPFLSLPDTWESYLKKQLGPKTRWMLEYSIRRIKRETNFCEEQSHSGNINHQIETLLTLWQKRWGYKPLEILNQWRGIMKRCFEGGALYLVTLWDNEIPLASLAAYGDQTKKTFSYFMGGYNREYAKLSPGKVVIGLSIQYAIKNGYKIFDFGRGHDEYKFEFGARERFNKNIIISRRNFGSTFLTCKHKMQLVIGKYWARYGIKSKDVKEYQGLTNEHGVGWSIF